MNALFDLFPLLLFFGAYKLGGLYPASAQSWLSSLFGAGITLEQAPVLLATAAGIVAAVLQVGYVKLRHGQVSKMLWLNCLLFLVSGGLSLVFHNEAFIKLKPSVLYGVGAIAFLWGVYSGKPLSQRFLADKLALPAERWQRFDIGWAGCFAALCLGNLAVAYGCSTDTWVNFKLFGVPAFLMLFSVIQVFSLPKNAWQPQKTSA